MFNSSIINLKDKLQYYLVLLFCVISLSLNGQSKFWSDIANRLPKSKFYFVGQGHNNEANTIIEKELLFSLNAKYHVQYDILENAHSAAFLINQYLQTGKEIFLKSIDSTASFNFIKAVKAYNDTISKNKRIRFYGIDFEGRQNGRIAQKAIEIIFHELKLPESETLHSLLRSIVDCQPKDIESNLLKLKFYLEDNNYKSRALLGKYYVDVLLIANAQFNFSPRRDGAMVANFKRLYDELIRNGEYPSFFASFGTAHINPENNNGIAIKLMNDVRSPIKDSVCIIGIQYFNCLFGKENKSKTTFGSLDFMCQNSDIEKLAGLQDRKNKLITFLQKEEFNMSDCNKKIRQLSGLILAYNFSATSFWLWE